MNRTFFGASAIALALFGSANIAHAATASSTLDWFSIDFRLIALDENVEPAYLAGSDFSSHASTFNSMESDWADAEDWTSDLTSSVGSVAASSVSGAAFPNKNFNDDGSNPNWRLLPNPMESLDASVDSVELAGANYARSFSLELGAQSLLIISFDYLLTYDLGMVPADGLLAFSHVGMESVGGGVLTVSEAWLDTYSGMSSAVKQGRILFTLANTSDDVVSYDLTAYGGASVLAVPEPAHWGMLLAGLGLIGAIARRTRG